MIVPAAMNIYSAQEMLKARAQQWLDDEKKEFLAAVPAASPDMVAGYLLGLETARAILMGQPPIYQAGLKPENLL